MSASNTGLISVTSHSDDAQGVEAHHVATLVKAIKDGTKLDSSYDAIFTAAMKNPESHNALMEAMMDNTRLSQLNVADFPKAIEVPSDYVKATGRDSIEQHLTPPYGTKGFVTFPHKVDGTNWILDVYGYRHANSDNVTLIIVHSGSITSGGMFIWPTLFTLWTTPETIHKSQYPETYESNLGDSRYSYRTDYTNTINMIGPDGRNPVPFQIVYKETFVSRRLDTQELPQDPTYLKFAQYPGPIHGLSIFNTSFEVGSSISIELGHGILISGPGSIIPTPNEIIQVVV